ncbi:MAG: COX15/CtaA family protein, partial [Actinomycetota bacterium]|nr:COX15/CtaA family protein [Actinomycetota bacterium]
MRRLPTVTPRTYLRIAYAALGVLTLIVFTGAAVRLTGSGLGCPDWPKCNGASLAPELETHGLIEFGNRLLTGVVGLPCILAFLAAFRRRPYRRDLTLIAFLLPLGVLAQAILGGMTVWYDLAPGWVMGHHLLSMLLLVAAVSLVWRSRYEPGERPWATDRAATWAVRALAPLGFVAIAAGTVATAAGPHAGGEGTGDEVDRIEWFGLETLEWAIKGHARIAAALGLAAVGVWWLLRRRGGDTLTRRALTVVCLLLAAQGAVGTTQYLLELPPGIVWVHVALAALTWIALLWA